MKKFFGYLLSFWGIAMFFLGIAMRLDTQSKQSRSGTPIAVLSFAFIVPGALLIYSAYKKEKLLESMNIIVSTINSFRRISMEDLSKTTGFSVPKSRELLLIAISKGMLEGYFDRTTGDFFTIEAEKDIKNIQRCISCGAPIEGIILKGETYICKNCGAMIQ